MIGGGKQLRGTFPELSSKISELEKSLENIKYDGRNSHLYKRGPTVTFEDIKEHVQRGFERRNDDKVKEVFNQFCETDDYIEEINFPRALEALDLNMNRKEIEHLFEFVDIGSNKKIYLEEFRSAVTASFTPIAGWVSSLPLCEMLVDALRNSKRQKDSLIALTELTESDIELIVKGYSEGLMKVLCSGVAELRRALHAMHTNANARKTTTEDGFVSKFLVGETMECGTLDSFHKGIEDRVGHPHLKFKEAMEQEHCSRPGNACEFETNNFNIKTTPKREWDLVVNKDALAKDEMELANRYGRVIPIIEDLLKLPIIGRANLSLEEVIALVMYTGPMFHIYNTILRRWPVDLFKVFNEGGNLFSTTIFILGSAVQKISRVTILPKGLRLYRGLSGVHFPESFYKNDKNGCTGYADWGFMSTTADRQVAIKYSTTSRDPKMLPKMLVITVGAVDRGACIDQFSQYPADVEYLWVPASFVEQNGPPYLGTTAKGVIEMYPVKVNANLRTVTMGELLKRKKTMHLTAFKYSIHEVNEELELLTDTAEARLSRDPTSKNNETDFTVANFKKKILDQCQDALKRHDLINPEDYRDDEVFRGMVLEMVDVKAMALSKMREWIENESSSFIQFRLNAALRTVHRRYIAFLQRQMDYIGDESKDSQNAPAGAVSAQKRRRATQCIVQDDKAKEHARKWCKIKGLIANNVNEENELNEKKLMVASAEGRSPIELRFLVAAGADVNGARPDGVTSLWLAAQFGHVLCIKALVELKADVNRPSNNKATPVCMAAQSGYHECIEILAAFGADVNLADDKGLTPAHQAAMNGNHECIVSLAKLGAKLDVACKAGKTPLINAAGSCKRILELLTIKPDASAAAAAAPGLAKKLIISSGDISDVDGFFALGKYAQSGADTLFVMNYPAYVAEMENIDDYDTKNPGLGYKYTADKVINEVKATEENRKRYESFLARYGKSLGSGDRMKAAMTDVAFFMANNVWRDFPKEKAGRLYFCIGGVNAINPFSAKAIKNEVGEYAPLLFEEVKDLKQLPVVEGKVYDESGSEASFDFAAYSDIYLDFNGSMAFYTDKWETEFGSAIGQRLKGAFVMGGVYADKAPLTMPSIVNMLNRFSSATLNQLYHPENAERLFKFLGSSIGLPVYLITYNVVHDLATFSDAEKKINTLDGVETFLHANGIHGAFLWRIAQEHYNSQYAPPRKAFHLYTAEAIMNFMQRGKEGLKADPKKLFFCDTYGLTFVSPPLYSWEQTLQSYAKGIDTALNPSDSDFIKTKKITFVKELGIIRAIENPFNLEVLDVSFLLDKDTRKLSIAP